MADAMITEEEFQKLVRANKLRGERTISALRLVLVYGSGKSEAAHAVGVDPAVVTVGLARLKRPVCPCCGQVVAPSSS